MIIWKYYRLLHSARTPLSLFVFERLFVLLKYDLCYVSKQKYN